MNFSLAGRSGKVQAQASNLANLSWNILGISLFIAVSPLQARCPAQDPSKAESLSGHGEATESQSYNQRTNYIPVISGTHCFREEIIALGLETRQPAPGAPPRFGIGETIRCADKHRLIGGCHFHQRFLAQVHQHFRGGGLNDSNHACLSGDSLESWWFSC